MTRQFTAIPAEGSLIAYKAFDENMQCRGEKWRAVPKFEGKYEASTEGRVRSLPRQTAAGVLGGRVLHPTVEKNGYLRVTLSVSGVRHREFLHRIILRTFVGECPKGWQCRHLDGNKSNCRLANLAWGTPKENASDRMSHGTHVDNRGERHGNSKITNAQAAEIKLARQSGRSLNDVAAEFGVSPPTVSRISNGKGWSHV
jgi:hypothetical protein